MEFALAAGCGGGSSVYSASSGAAQSDCSVIAFVGAGGRWGIAVRLPLAGESFPFMVAAAARCGTWSFGDEQTCALPPYRW